MRLSVRQIVLYALLGALLVAVQLALAVLPNIELVSLLLIVYGVTLGRRAFYPLSVFVLCEGLIFGMGLWFINYCYVWALLLGGAILLRHAERYALIALSTVFGLCFGALCSIPYLFMGGPAAMWSYFVAGIPYDLLHGLGNAAAALLLLAPLRKLLENLLAKVV